MSCEDLIEFLQAREVTPPGPLPAEMPREELATLLLACALRHAQVATSGRDNARSDAQAIANQVAFSVLTQLEKGKVLHHPSAFVQKAVHNALLTLIRRERGGDEPVVIGGLGTDLILGDRDEAAIYEADESDEWSWLDDSRRPLEARLSRSVSEVLRAIDKAIVLYGQQPRCARSAAALRYLLLEVPPRDEPEVTQWVGEQVGERSKETWWRALAIARSSGWHFVIQEVTRGAAVDADRDAVLAYLGKTRNMVDLHVES